ncbi:DUF6069 family protein [Actinoplanes sp. TBRC 11911]|uniref:DUF6069 family protein n=1 Tax=Actinoplanes sp. TBRC 11911 TaxID=2729386 RepID=UPI001B7D4AC7|nr:DUF6069 family protein [Actinoplanes sp. TBRC 11911]
MTEMYRSSAAPPQPALNAGKLWAGGLATALLAALIAVVGIVIGRGLFDVQVLAPKGDGVWGDASTFWYALGAAGGSLLATALVHVLVLFAPKPMRFFGWLIALATIGAMAAPFATDQETGSKLYTALLNLILGVAIGSLVAGSARAAIRPVAPARAYP